MMQVAPDVTRITEHEAEPSFSLSTASPAHLPGRQWAVVPLLAFAAYAPVLSMWFIADDFGHLRYNERLPWPAPFTTIVGMQFYRPLSTSITWELFPSLFGTNALPYHILSLGLHMLAAWMLARLLTVISGEARLGWIAGALFAVYPLSTEAVGWLASQWDEWAAVCLLGAVWGYSLFLKNGNKRAYILGLLSAGVGVFMKESILPLPLLLPFVALAMGLSAKPGYSFSLQEIIRLATKGIMPALPFALPSLLFVGLRFATGGIGGYKGAVTDYNHFFWDALTSAGQQFLLPLNRSVFPRTFVQVVGAATGLLSVIALAAWGRRRLPMLGLALVWSLFFLLPVLNLIVIPNPNVLGNRVLYLSLLGVCMGIATLALGALESTRFSIFARALLLAGLVAIVPLTWVQLGPWVQSSRQTRHIVDELGSLIIDAPGRRLDMNVKNLPREYKGSYVFWNALDDALAVFYNQYVLLSTNTRLDATGSGGSSAGSYDLAFSLGDDDLFHVSKISGQVAASLIPPGGQRVWDLSGCRGPVPGLRAVDAAFDCVKEANAPPRPGTSYAVFAPKSADGQLILDGIAVDTAGYSWLRLAVCARYRGLADSLGEWFWMSDNSSWDAAYSKRFVLNSAGAWRVYLTYLPVEQLRSGVNGLRFDPTNVKESVDIQWISLDLVK